MEVLLLKLSLTPIYIFIGFLMLESISHKISDMKNTNLKPLVRLVSLFLWPVTLIIVMSYSSYFYMRNYVLKEWAK